MGKRKGSQPFDIDAGPNADWIKSLSWGLQHGGKTVSSLDELRAALGRDDERLAHFMELPAARPMPEEVRAAVNEYFRTPRWAPTEAIFRALTFAIGLHARQGRKNPTRDPYLVHLLTVAALVGEDGGSEKDVIGALLHDAVEDHPILGSDGRRRRLEQIHSDFGDGVARIVEGCTDTFDDEKPDWKPRKERYLAHLPHEPPEVLRVSLSDKLHNARCLVADLEQGRGWALFNAGPEDQVWYYTELRKAFVESRTTSRHLGEFRRLVDVITVEVALSSQRGRRLEPASGVARKGPATG